MERRNHTALMSTNRHTLNIDQLIEIVKNGGAVKTGVDIYSKDTILLLEKNVLIKSVKPLLVIKQNGVTEVPINPNNMGGLWDRNGQSVLPVEPDTKSAAPFTLKERVERITRVKEEALEKYQKAKENIKNIIEDIKKSDGKFDQAAVDSTVTDLFNFINKNDGAFFYLTRDIFSYDDYLYNHSINVCTIGTAIMKKATRLFGDKFQQYSAQDLLDISTGFFLHDVGKILVPFDILNKPGKLTPDEFDIVREHSFKLGDQILKKNNIRSRYIRDIVRYHHSALFEGEDRYYPPMKGNTGAPLHVKVSKLADIFDAMTSKRCYKDAYNPVEVVTTIVRSYSGKEESLQLLLHAFVKSVGIFPPGSVVTLTSRQLAYVLDSDGPIVIPFTNNRGEPLVNKADPVDLADQASVEAGWKVNDEKPLLSPVEAYQLLPEYLKEPMAVAG